MTEKITKKFNPDDHMQDIKGHPYLPVAWRIFWFREEHTDWSIETEVKDNREEKTAIAKAVIKDTTGRIIATAHKTAKPSGIITDYLEKAETGAIGRALALCGYGTQFAPELEEGEEVVDSPIATKNVSTGIVDDSVGATPVTPDKASTAQLAKIRAIYGEKKLSNEAMKELVAKRFKITSHKDLSKKQASEWIEYLLTIEPVKEEVNDILNGEVF
jgi:hypothetical protein